MFSYDYGMIYDRKNLKNLPVLERPRERMFKFGPKVLSITELVIILLGRGSPGYRVEQIAQAVTDRLVSMDFSESFDPDSLMKIPGMGKAKACQICAAIEISKRSYKRNTIKTPYIPEMVGKLVEPFIPTNSVENLFVISLDSRKKILGVDKVSVGGVNEVTIHPREVFKKAINRLASYIVLVHNHPSGDHTPSRDDLVATERILNVSRIIGIPLLDHIIIGRSGFTSMKKEEYIEEYLL